MPVFEIEDLMALSEAKKIFPNSLFSLISEKRSIFNMHIPKTGGTYVNSYFQGLPGLKIYHNPHLTCNSDFNLYPDPTDTIPRSGMFQDREGYRNSLRISVVRNPFEWLTSYYFHEEGSLPWNTIEGVAGCRSMYPDFNEFVNAYCSEDLYWPKGLSMFKKFYPFQIFDKNGNCCSDIVIKSTLAGQELSMALNVISIGLGYTQKQVRDAHEKSNKRKSLKKKNHYLDYYSEDSIEKLKIKWKNILSTFRYDEFGSTSADEILIKGDALKYDAIKNSVVRV